MSERTRTEIVASILQSAINGATKPSIQFKAAISYETLEAFVQLLTNNGLIEYDGRKFRTIEKGHEFLRLYKHTRSLLNEGVRDDNS